MLDNMETMIDWSRAQFALTAMYHWLFVPLTLGLAVIMGVMETRYVISGHDFWKRTARFWMKLFGINFAIGVATGLILEFQFGTNWSNYSWFVGDIFGALSFPFYVFAFVDIAILENGFPFTVRLSAFHLSGVYGTVFERIVSDFDFCGEGVFNFTKEAPLALRHSAFLREKNQYECSI